MKKAHEFSVKLKWEIAIVIFDNSNKLCVYASTDMDSILLNYTQYDSSFENFSNEDINDMLNNLKLIS